MPRDQHHSTSEHAASDNAIDPDILDTKIVIGFGNNARDSAPKDIAGSVRQFLDGQLATYAKGPKDGPYLLQGQTINGKRGSKNQGANHLVLIDVDNGTPREDLIAKVQELALFAVVYATHSQGRPTSAVTEAALTAFLGKRGEAIASDASSPQSIGQCRAYFREQKHFTPALLDSFSGVERRAGDHGMEYVVTHAPMDRTRILFLLHAPFSFTDGGTQNARINRWKALYKGMCRVLGVHCDESCDDPARLMYLPRGKNGAAGMPPIVFINGAKLDLEVVAGPMVKTAASEDAAKARSGKGTKTRSGPQSKNGVPSELIRFITDYDDFNAVEFVEAHDPDGAREGGPANGRNWRCPNEANHSEIKDDDTAFMVASDHTWTMMCHHQTCKTMSEGDRAWYLWTFMENHSLTIDDLRPFSAKARSEDASGGAFVVKDGRPVANDPFNIRLAVKKMGVKLTFDDLAQQVRVEGLWDRGADLDDAALNHFRLRVHEDFGFLPQKELFADVIFDYARKYSFHPVKDYLADMQPMWDGTQRLDTLLITYFGAEDTPLNRAWGRIWMTAACRRMRRPGCKFDELLVLISEQGTGKSSGIAALCGRQEWFTDCLPMNAGSKEAIEQSRGKWIAEIAELLGGHRDIEVIKVFLSRQVDIARNAYARLPENVPRSFVCIGTTNSEQFLRDRTGNRRFWPVTVGKIDVVALKRDRDQLWAEAAVLEAADASDTPIRLDPTLRSTAEDVQKGRLVINQYKDPLEAALGDRTGRIKVDDVYLLLGVSAEKRHQIMAELIAEAMRELGWEKKKMKFVSRTLNGYARGTEAERATILSLVKGETTGRLQLDPEEGTFLAAVMAMQTPAEARPN